MRASLQRFDRGQGSAPEMPQVDEAAERLAALGYVGGGRASGRSVSGVDLKDKIAEVQRYTRDMREGLRLYREGQFAAAARLLRRVSETSPPSFNVQYYLGRSLLDCAAVRRGHPVPSEGGGDGSDAAHPVGPRGGPDLRLAGRGLRRGGPDSTALQTLDTALAVAPANAELLRAKGSLLLRQGDLGGARTALGEGPLLSAREARLHVELSNVYRNLGELAPAEAAAREAVRLEPKSPDARVALGLALGALGREENAGRAFREALRLAPNHPDALFYLGAIDFAPEGPRRR